jgi:hypothetical protein
MDELAKENAELRVKYNGERAIYFRKFILKFPPF